MITLPIIVLAPIFVFALYMFSAASSDLAHAPEDDYEAKIGYDSGKGWAVTIIGILILVVFAGSAGCGPLAGMVDFVK